MPTFISKPRLLRGSKDFILGSLELAKLKIKSLELQGGCQGHIRGFIRELVPGVRLGLGLRGLALGSKDFILDRSGSEKLKIKSLEALVSLLELGFRGLALSSKDFI